MMVYLTRDRFNAIDGFSLCVLTSLAADHFWIAVMAWIVLAFISSWLTVYVRRQKGPAK